MSFGIPDYIVTAVFMAMTFGAAYFFSSKEKTLDSHFRSSGSLSWFVSGTAMVATTFAADTPLAVTELVAKYGIAGNWIWWYMGISSVATVFFFAPLWKASGVGTDIELVKLRYDSGSDILRIIKSLYLGLLMNIIILTWVNLAMLKICTVLFPSYPAWAIVSFFCFAGFLYTGLSGLRGISYTDAFQFFFAIGACIVLAWFALADERIGGTAGLQAKLPSEFFSIFPSDGKVSAFSSQEFIIFVTVVWWASWYPGAEPGGGGYIAQRILASKDEKSSMFAALWFTIAHYFIRPWPWILTALASTVLFPNLSSADKGNGFVMVMKEVLPSGLLGLLFSAFLAAYLSTVATHLNWGSSYLTSDLYKPYLNPGKEDSHYLKFSLLVEFISMAASLTAAFFYVDSISGIWKFLLECGAGVGFALIARWFIPRINAWAELAGFVSPVIFYTLNKLFFHIPAPLSIVFVSLSVSLTVVLTAVLTVPVNAEVLKHFYEKVKPPGYFWKKWAQKHGVIEEEPFLKPLPAFFCSISALVLVYSLLCAAGYFIFGKYPELAVSSVTALGSGIFLYFRLKSA
ncbi:MAG TPA: Na+:solute symporter [Leptospiraceae bacterium]|nr:Na+:solute symporter [Leptospiraceae bacterium]HNM01979.1 Na+:solute symporter [Leptospiraceae bacterium]HNN04595.1 Na+:solute symporter [Leptospiraceae bacterium]